MNANAPVLDAASNRIIGCAITVSSDLGIGFLEKVYENENPPHRSGLVKSPNGCRRHAAFAFICDLCVHLRYNLLRRTRCRTRVDRGVDAGPASGMTWMDGVT
jgi:hypothetical protein